VNYKDTKKKEKNFLPSSSAIESLKMNEIDLHSKLKVSSEMLLNRCD
jgi:hypothetical protein